MNRVVVGMVFLYISLVGCSSVPLVRIGTVIVVNPHIPQALFYYYIHDNDIRVEAKIKDRYYLGNIVVAPKTPYSRGNQSVLRMVDNQGDMIQCSINNNGRHIKKGGAGSCYHNGGRVFDIRLGVARYDKVQKKNKWKFLAI